MGGGFQTYWASSVVYVALLPIFVASHEFGHAAVTLARSEAPVVVGLGRPPGRWRFRLGRIDVTLGLNFWSYRKPAGTVSRVPLDKWSTVACGAAGPLAQAGASALLLPVGVVMHSALIGDAGILGIGFSLVSLVPFRFHGYRSDGANVLHLLRRENLAERRGRWLALFTDVKGTVRGASRARLLGGVVDDLGYDAASTAGLRLWHLAFAGWCWEAVNVSHSSGDEDGLSALPPALVDFDVEEEHKRSAFKYGREIYALERARGSLE